MLEKLKSLASATSKIGATSIISKLSKMESDMESALAQAKKLNIDDTKGLGINLASAKQFIQTAKKGYETWPAKKRSSFDKMIEDFGYSVADNIEELDKSIQMRSHRDHKPPKKFAIKSGRYKLAQKRRRYPIVVARENA